MSRLEFIFSAVNAIASRKEDEGIEYLLVEAVQHEIENTKQERCATPAAGLQVTSNGRGSQVQSLTLQTAKRSDLTVQRNATSYRSAQKTSRSQRIG